MGSHRAAHLRTTFLLALSLPLLLLQIAHAGTLSSVAPTAASIGVAISINGTGFDPTAANNLITFAPAAGAPVSATATATTLLDASTGIRRVTVKVPAGVPVGTTALRVTNQVTGEISEGRSLQVVALSLPGTTGALPGTSALDVRITGSSNVTFVPTGTRVGFGAGITVTAVRVDAANSLVATITVAATATAGARDVTVISGSLTAIAPGGFAVTAPGANRAPVANAGGPYSATVGDTITFDGRASSDPDGDPLTYAWDFGDGTPSATGATAGHSYPAAGDYSVHLTVTDNQGATATASVTARVSTINHAPVPVIGGPYSGTAGKAVIVSGAGSSDADGDPITYTFAFGDGAAPVTTANVSIAHVYAAAGDFTITLSVADNRGGSGTATTAAHITASNTPPVASIGGPYSGTAGQPVAISAAGSTDPDGDPLSYTFSFGDGTAPLVTTVAGVSHVFASSGDFTISVTVSDGRGGTAAASTTAHVAAPANAAPVVSAGPGQTITLPAGAALAGSVTDDGLPQGAPVTSTWSMVSGPGTVVFANAASPATTATFSQPGTYVLRLTASDSALSASADVTIVVNPVPNHAPQITSTPITTARHQFDYVYQVTASDSDGDSLTFSLPVAPAGMMIDPTGRIEWKPIGGQIGVQAVSVAVTDSHSATATQPFTITVVDVTPPFVVLTAPAQAQAGNDVTVSAQASDNVGVAAVVIEINGGSSVTLQNAPYQRAISIPVGTAAGTAFHIRATARDAAGNLATDDKTFAVVAAPDTQNPTVAIGAPATTVAGATIHVSATAADNVGVASVAFSVEDAPLASVAAPPFETTYVVPAGTAAGTALRFSARATDFSGNFADAGATVTVTDVPDTTAPAVDIAAPATVPERSALTVSSNASDDIGVERVAFFVNGVEIAVVAAAPYQTSYSLAPGIAAGDTLHVEARARDFAGNEATASTATIVTAAPPNQLPIAHAGGPYAGQAGDTIAFSSAGTSDPDQDALVLDWNFGDGTHGTGSAPTHVYTAAGSYSITLAVSDGRGGAATATATAAITAPSDTIPPVVTLSAPASALPGARITVTAFPVDDKTVAGVTFEVDGSNPTDVTVAPYQRIVDVPGVATPGSTIAVRATARDAAGNTGAADAAITISTQPDTERPAVTVAAPPQATPGSSIHIGSIASDNVGVASVALLVNGSTIATLNAIPYETMFPVSADAVPGTALSVTARATDFSGNQSDASATVAIVPTAQADTQPPTVSIAAPAMIVAGNALAISATAADNTGIASVAFFVDGIKMRTVLAPPYTASFTVPSTTPNGTTLHLIAVATDLSGLTASAPATTAVVAVSQLRRGVVTGEVYDDTSGLPAPGLPVMLVGTDAGGTAYSATTTTDSRGRFVLRGTEGQAVVRIGGAGTTLIERPATISANEALEIFDGRVTPIGTPAAVTPVLGGALSAPNAVLTIAPGALTSSQQLSLTSVGPQGLEGLLPIGWSPAAAIDVSPHGTTFTGGAAVAVSGSVPLPAGTAIVLATWDETASAWRAVVVTSIVDPGAPLEATLPASGEYAWLVADTMPAGPPAPNPGERLAGTPGVEVPVDTATAITPQPKVAFYKPGLRIPVRGAIDSNNALPSGTPIQARLTENYAFAGGSQAHLDPYVADLVFYQLGAAAGQAGGTFVVTPSLTFEAITLQKGVISVELLAPAAGPRVVPIVDATGGTVQSSTGDAVIVPAGAVGDTLPIQISRIAADQVGITLPPPLELVGAVDVAFAGSLNAGAAVAIPNAGGIGADAQVLLVRVAAVNGQTRLVFVAGATIAPDRITSSTAIGTAAGTPEGVRVPGRYVFVRSTVALAYVSGTVLGVNGSGPVAGALVTSSSFPTVALSMVAGTYAAAVAAGSVTLTAQDLTRNDSGSGDAAPASGSVATLDLQLLQQVPHVTSVTPTNNSSGVALSDPLRVTFSEPIDPATVNGANAGNVLLTGPDGSPVPGTIALTGGNTALTFRPAAPLTSNTVYTFTIAQGITDLSGNPLAAAIVVHFTSLNTAPPPAPPAGAINASIPDASGHTTITATQGSAGLHDTVTIRNVTSQAVYPVLIDPNGGFTVTVAAGLTDKLQVVITGQTGGQTVVDVPGFRQVNPDGSVSAAVTAEGAHIDGPGGIAVDVPAGAFPDGAVVTLKPIAAADFPVQLDEEGTQQLTFAGAIDLNFGGSTPEKYLNVSIPAGPDDTATDQWVVSEVRENNGTNALSVVDTARVIDGRIQTSSPPCPGVTAQGVYGFHKSTREVGKNYGLMYANGYGGLAINVDYPFLNFMVAPLAIFEPVVPREVCYPVLTGHVTVSENSQRIVIAPDQLTPADREIVIKNTTTGTETHYPRDVLEFTFEVDGVSTDSYQVTIVSGAVSQPAGSVTVTTATSTSVLVHLNPDTIPVSVTSVIVVNVTKATTHTFQVDQVALKLKAPGGASDAYDVSITDAGGQQRKPTFTIESPTGAGNLVARAAPASIDPTRAEIDAYNAEHPESPIVGAGRTGLTLSNDTTHTTMTIPDAEVVGGGFTYAFNGRVSDQYSITVTYEDGKVDTRALPNFRITVRNRTTGKVIKTILGQAPPRDEPLNLGVLSDDAEPPMLTAGPPRMTNFDPATPLSFTFSEAMNAQSLKDGLIVEWVTSSGERRRVDGTVRVSAGNTVVTFVPTTSLRIGEEYSITFIGRDALGTLLVPGGSPITDRSGNSLGTTRFVLKTFKPRKVGSFVADVDYAGQKIGIKDVEIRRKEVDQTLRTYLYGLGDSASGYRYVTFDVTDPAAPTKVGTVGVGGSGKKQLRLLTDLGGVNPAMPARGTFTKCDGTGATSFTGDMAVASSWNTYYSFVSFFDTTDPASPCWLANKLFTATPDTLSSYSSKGTVHVLGSARGVTTLQHTQGYAAYVAVGDVGLFATDIGRNLPEYTPDDRVKEGMYPGNFWDVVTVNDKLLAIDRDSQQLDVIDPNLSLLGSVDLPDPPRRMTTVQAFPVDVNENGIIEPDEQFDLAFIAGDNPATGSASIQIVDITNLDEMKVIGSIPMPGITRELAMDKSTFRLFAGGVTKPGGEAFYMIDVSDPFRTGSIDFDQDGFDDRIVWRQPYPAGINGFRIDSARGLAYVGHPDGLDVWAIYELCCDLSVNMAAQPDQGQSGDRAALLAKESQALLQEIQNGLADASAHCGVASSSLSILEQGSGACLWKLDPKTNKPDPVAACTTTYQPGLSDHDYEVFFPTGFPAGTQSCVTKALSDRFTDPVTKKPKKIQLPDSQSPIEFDDVTFFPFSKDDFETGHMNVLPPRSAGGDATGDLGLGRRQLLLLWLLGGEYVPLSGLAAGRPQDDILHDLLTDTNLGIKPLEGYEWAKLQTYNLAKGKVFLRLSGASNPESSLHAFYVKQLHDAAKAAVRTAFGRLIADPAGNISFRTITRDAYNTNACIGVDPAVNDPNAWTEKPCTSFEEFAQSAIAKTLRGPTPLSIFTVAEVQNIARFYRVKVDLERITSDAAADAFIALAASFIDNAAASTEAVYTRDIPSDPDRVQRGLNLDSAQSLGQEALKTTKVVLQPHVANRGFRSADQVELAMYLTDAAGSGAQFRTIDIDLAGGENKYFDYEHNTDGSLKLDAKGDPVPVFLLGPDPSGQKPNPVDLTALAPGQLHGVSFTIDLPDKTIKEANRQNNVGGFFYYRLDVGNPTRPAIPPSPYVPLADPNVLNPDPQCDEPPVPRVSEAVIYNNQTYTDTLFVATNTPITIRLTVDNSGGDAMASAKACSAITRQCYDIGPVGANATVTYDITFTTPAFGQRFEGAPTFQSEDAGIVQGATFALVVGCEAWRIIPLEQDPNPAVPAAGKPDERVLMRGGVVLRYFKVVNRDTYQPKGNATVEVEVTGPTAPLTYTFKTDANGLIVDDVYPEGGMAFALDSSAPIDSSYTVTLTKVDGQSTYCEAPTSLAIKVTDPEYTRGLNAGASIAAEATALIGLQGKAGTGLETTVTERMTQGRQKLGLKRTVNFGAGGQIGAELGGSFKFGGLVTGELAAKLKGTLSVIFSADNTHEFTYQANSIPQNQSTALGGLLVATLATAGVDNVFVQKLVDVLIQQVASLDSYKTSEAFNIGLEAGLSGSAGATASFTPISKLGENFGDIDIGLDANIGTGVSASATVGVENKPRDNELVPNYLLKAQIDVSAALGTGNVQPNWSQEKLRNVLKLREKLTGGMKGTTAGSWSAKLTLDRANGYNPKKLVIAYSNVKSYGWKASGTGPGATLIPAGGGTSSDTTTTTYTITDPVVIQQAIDSLNSITRIASVVNLLPGGGVLLGPTVLVAETVTLFDILSENDATYTIAAKKGDAVEFPFEIGLGAGAVMKLGAGVKFDRSIGFTTEKGVIKKGRWYPLEKYTAENFPSLPPTTDTSDIHEMLQTGLDALSNFGSAAISTVTAAVQSGTNTIRSLLTAELTFDGATAGTNEVALSSFHFNEIPGPVAPRPYRPSDVSGPAGKPHYGVGGFHQFSPGNLTLGSPATLKFFYEADEVANIDPSTLRIFAFDQNTEEWTPLPSTVDAANRTVTTTVNTLGLYTAAPPMPAGPINLTPQSVASGTTENPTTTITYTSDVILMNTGDQVPDGAMFTVATEWPGALGVPFGTITSPDEGAADGVQVTAHNGRIQFVVVVPGTFGAVQVNSFSQEGTALGRQVVPYQP